LAAIARAAVPASRPPPRPKAFRRGKQRNFTHPSAKGLFTCVNYWKANVQKYSSLFQDFFSVFALLFVAAQNSHGTMGLSVATWVN